MVQIICHGIRTNVCWGFTTGVDLCLDVYLSACGTEGYGLTVDLAVLDLQLDSMVWKMFSNQNDPVIL